MRIFLSWSGSRSQELALLLKTELPKVVPGLTAWISSEDLAAGTFWSESLQKELDGFDAAILCLTPENTRSPWMLFEAGALMKATDASRVIPFTWRLEPRELGHPLSHFQGFSVDREGTRRLVSTLRALQGNQSQSGNDNSWLDTWWPGVSKQLEAIPDQVAGCTFAEALQF